MIFSEKPAPTFPDQAPEDAPATYGSRLPNDLPQFTEVEIRHERRHLEASGEPKTIDHAAQPVD